MSDDLDFMPADGGGESDGDAPAPGGDEAPGTRAELPTWNRSRRKRKANVKAEQEDDAFKRGVRKAGRQVIDTPRLVIGAISIGVLAIGGGVALTNYKAKSAAEATRTLQTATLAIARGQIMSPEELERVDKEMRLDRLPLFTTQEELDAAIAEAIEGARGVESDIVAQDVRLIAASQAVKKGEWDAALGEYEAFLSEAGKRHPLRFMGLEGKGIVLEAQGDLEGALAAFQAIAPDPTDHYRDMALYHQGRVLEGLDRKDEAIALYQEYLTEFTKEMASTPLVRERLEALDPTLAASLAAPPAGGGSPIQLPPMP